MKTPYFAVLSQSALDVDCGRFCPLEWKDQNQSQE
jgi:hypothetical protein